MRREIKFTYFKLSADYWQLYMKVPFKGKFCHPHHSRAAIVMGSYLAEQTGNVLMVPFGGTDVT